MRLVSAAQFKAAYRSQQRGATAGLGIVKQVIAPVEPVNERAIRFTISTQAVDREQDTIAIDGWVLDNFLRNPVVLWSHDISRLPIGRAIDVGIEGSALKATVEFIPEDVPEGGAFAESVHRLCRMGFICATSVGFRPIKWAYTDDKARGADDWFPGIDFTEQELVELSIVTVPANPEALADDPPIGGDGVAIASDTPPQSGEEITSFNEEEARERARRRRVLQLAGIRVP